jgi:Na+/H+ antiporter NhaD/arsenite permease-like protein
LGQQVAAEAAFSPGWQVIAAVAVFLVVYAVIITEKMSRALVALAGAVLAALLGVVGLEEAYNFHVSWRMIFLLVGMMLLTGMASRTGLVQFAALKAAQRVKGDPVKILVVLTVATAVGSALLDNVTAVLLVVPLTFSIARVLKVSPMKYLTAEIVAANIGGAATMIGSLPNMMIGGANPRLTYGDFLVHTGLVSCLILILTVSLLVYFYRGQLAAGKEERKELLAIDAAGAIQDRPMALKTLIVFGLTVLGFLLHGPLSAWTGVRVEAAAVALAGATLLMLVGLKGKAVDEALDGVEWRTVVFFAGLFAIVGGLAETGVIGRLATMALQLASGDIGYLSVLVLWLSGIVSATVDNTPFVAAMIPLVQELGVQMNPEAPEALDPVWWSLALGASLGGSGTLIGAAANVVVAGLAAREGREISYFDYLKIGAPVALLSLAIATGFVCLFLL